MIDGFWTEVLLLLTNILVGYAIKQLRRQRILWQSIYGVKTNGNSGGLIQRIQQLESMTRENRETLLRLEAKDQSPDPYDDE